MIVNGKFLPLGQQSAALPHVGEAVKNCFQPVAVGFIVSTQVDGYTQSLVRERIMTHGARIENPKSLVITKTGERIWKTTDIYFTRDVLLKADDLFLFNDIQYRVLETEEWTEYGYNRYRCVQDYRKIFELNPDVVSIK